jgi:hypothetical protein
MLSNFGLKSFAKNAEFDQIAQIYGNSAMVKAKSYVRSMTISCTFSLDLLLIDLEKNIGSQGRNR